MLTCILLAAGLSERFGSPKALAKINGQTVIQRLQQTLLATSIGEIVVVLGSRADDIRPSIFIHSRIAVVYNKHYNFGQTSSVKEGWRAAKESDGILLLPVDCPMVKPATIEGIVEEFNKTRPDVLIPSYQHKKGHPPVFHHRLKDKVLNLANDAGLNTLFQEHPPQIMESEDPGVIQTFNSVEEFEKLKRLTCSK